MNINNWLRLLSPSVATIPRMVSLAEAVLRQAVDLADLIETLPAAFAPSYASGKQLDSLGASLDMPRSDIGTGASDSAYRQYLISGLALRRWDGRNESLKALMEGAGITGSYADHSDLTVTAPAGAPVPAGIQRRT